MIEVKHITKTYGAKTTAFTALHDISFSVPDGATVAIVGRSGSGKSTLMHAIAGLDRPQHGEVIIDDQNILKWNQNKIDDFRAREMSFVFQSFFVQGNETCAHNVSLPLEITNLTGRAREEAISKALHAVGLESKKHELAKNLSGGQKQRLAVARAIVRQPKILFADEPTGNLDTTTGAEVEKLLFSYNQDHGTTLFIVTHDEVLAQKCQIQIFLEDGKLVKITGNTKPTSQTKKGTK
ncbi:MAG: ABC transporter ATP-binding protein [Candidatus Nomurabacteria bacterium]|jgi:putative ABC transport system ATP-binding protein|nr:ABC transporter ATP-binding protein [Candidatus Nomurabacteria bacterium]